MGGASSQCLVSGLLAVAKTRRTVSQATPSFRTLGSCNELRKIWAVPRAFGSGSGMVCKLQVSESNKGWCLVLMPSSMVPSEVIGSASGTFSQTLSGGSHTYLQSQEIIAVVCPFHLWTTQKAPCPTQPRLELLHKLLLVSGSWEVTVIKHVWVLPGAFGSGNSRVSGFKGSETINGWCSAALPSFFAKL